VSDKETAPWNLQHEANELLRNLDRVIFRGQLEIWKAPLAVALIEDFAGRFAVECTAQAPTQRRNFEEWEVVRGGEGDDWGIRRKGETHGMSIAQMVDEDDVIEIVRLHNSATPQGTPTETTGLFPPNSSKNWQNP
jgi:hypothetical protein